MGDLRVFGKRRRNTPTVAADAAAAVKPCSGDAIPEGKRHDTLFKLGCRLRDTGLGANASEPSGQRFRPGDRQLARRAFLCLVRGEPSMTRTEGILPSGAS